MVIESEKNVHPYNAIDAGVFYDENTSRMWMTWGSFWDGIFITELDPATGKRITPNSQTINIAARAQGSAIEASYRMQRDGFYYLFVNWGSCCQGVNSTYNIRVGRGTSPTGPFEDRSGVAMTSGGGDLFLGTEGSFIGPGHFGAFSEDGVDYFGYHYYDRSNNGAAMFDIEELAWSADGWPLLAANLPPGDYNRDGTVGAGDYPVWRNLLGQSVVPGTRADGTGPGGVPDGLVDLLDYELWKTHYGEMIPGSGSSLADGATNVPEPGGLALAVTAVALATLSRFGIRRANNSPPSDHGCGRPEKWDIRRGILPSRMTA